MLCRIADLTVEIPEAGGLPPRCKDYQIDAPQAPDIVIHPCRFRKDRYSATISEEMLTYLESGKQFAVELIRYHGFYLHASAVEMNGRAYLFSGPSGTGKTTHANLWKQLYGTEAQIINDDKPALRRVDGQWYAYGTPWCGKDGINQNKKVPIGGICFLKQSDQNRIRRLSNQEALTCVLWQTVRRFSNTEKLDLLLDSIDKLIREIPVFLLENRPDEAAAILSHDTMYTAMQEAEL